MKISSNEKKGLKELLIRNKDRAQRCETRPLKARKIGNRVNFSQHNHSYYNGRLNNSMVNSSFNGHSTSFNTSYNSGKNGSFENGPRLILTNGRSYNSSDSYSNKTHIRRSDSYSNMNNNHRRGDSYSNMNSNHNSQHWQLDIETVNYLEIWKVGNRVFQIGKINQDNKYMSEFIKLFYKGFKFVPKYHQNKHDILKNFFLNINDEM